MKNFFKPKKLFLTIILVILINSIFLLNAKANTVGPAEWTQYRLNPENNPVYHSSFNHSFDNIIKTNNEVRSTPVVVGDNIYIGNHESGDMYSYDLISKEMNWQTTAPNWIHSEIIYANNQLFVGYGNRFFQEDGIRGTEESGLLSLDPETGELLWNYKTEGEVMPTPAFYNNTVYITTGDKYLYAIDPETGLEKWKLEIGHVISMSSPNIKDGILYVGGGTPSPYTFTAINLSEEKILWQKSFEDIVAGLDDVPPVVYEDLVITTAVEQFNNDFFIKELLTNNNLFDTFNYLFSFITELITNESSNPYYKHVIYGLNIETGEVVWKDSLGIGPMIPNNKSGAPIIYEDKVFVGSPITKSFYSYNASTGNQIWSFESNINKAPPVADKGLVYFTDTKGYIYAFEANEGNLVGKEYLGGNLAPSGPIIMNNHLIVGSQDSNVYIIPIDEIINKKIDSGE